MNYDEELHRQTPDTEDREGNLGGFADSTSPKAAPSQADALSANAKLRLPRDKMKKITIAFDVDGTLRCNCTPTCTDAKVDVVVLFHVLNGFKNTKLYVWSGGGAEYARNAAIRYGLAIPESRMISKLSGFRPDIAVDDIQDTAIGGINLIVNQKPKPENLVSVTDMVANLIATDGEVK